MSHHLIVIAKRNILKKFKRLKLQIVLLKSKRMINKLYLLILPKQLIKTMSLMRIKKLYRKK